MASQNASVGVRSARSSRVTCNIESWLDGRHRHLLRSAFGRIANGSGSRVCDRSRSGSPTSGQRSSRSRHTSSPSRLPRAPTRLTTRPSSTPWPTSEARRDLDRRCRHRIPRQATACRDRSRRSIRRHCVGDRLCPHDRPHRRTVDPTARRRQRRHRDPRVESVDGRQDHHGPAIEAG
jgi:hypothetical protein